MSAKSLVDVNHGMLTLSSDGGVNWPRTCRLAEFAAQDGVSRAVATTTYDCLDAVRRRLPHVSGLLKQNQIDLEVVPAIEFTLCRDLFESVTHAAAVLGGPMQQYVFLRIRPDTVLPVVPVVQKLTEQQLTPILLAPERGVRFQRDTSELEQVVAAGGMIQLSAASLADQTDRPRMRFCRQLLRRGLCHFVASESGHHHDLPIALSQAHETVASWVGVEVANAVCCENPNHVFEGRPFNATTLQRKFKHLFSRAA